MLHIPCMVSVVGRSQQRRERWMVPTQGRPGAACEFSMFADGSLNELAAVAGGRRPKAIADEFSE